MEYFVYKYVFDDGGVYIGRTFEGSGRFGDVGKYKGQYVYSKMMEQGFKKVVVYKSSNLFLIYHLESILISWYKKELGSKCYNGSDELDWYRKALWDLGKDEDIKMSNIGAMVDEYKRLLVQSDLIVKCINGYFDFEEGAGYKDMGELI